MAMYGPPPALTQDDLLAALTRNFPDHWIIPLLNDPSSSSMFVGMIASMLRVSLAGDVNIDTGCFILSAPGAQPATCTALVHRPGGPAGFFPVGFRIKDTRGTSWRVLTAVAYGIGVTDVSLSVATERKGYYLNTFLPPTFQFSDVPPDINWAFIPGTLPASGGTSPYLDQHGIERSTFRGPGESDDNYSHRMLLLPDQVSPDALAQTIIQVLASFPATKPFTDFILKSGFRPMLEVFDDSAQPFEPGLFKLSPAFFDDVSYFDDPVGQGTMRGFADALAFFNVYLPTPVSTVESRLFLDVGFFDDPEFGYGDLPAGSDITLPLATLVDELDRKRAAGVRFNVILGEDLQVVQHPKDVVQAVSWAFEGDQNPTTIQGALDRHDADSSFVVSTVGAGGALGVQADDLVVSTPPLTNPGRVPVSVTAVRVVGWVRQALTGALNPPQFEFIVGSQRVQGNNGFPITPTQDWAEYSAIMMQNPITSLPWTVGDVSGTFSFGIANVATGTTDELRVSELRLEFVLNYA